MDEEKPSFTPNRKWRVGLNEAIALLSALALVIMANYLAARHPVRYNWAESGIKLSPLTVRALNALTNKVKVVVFYDPNEPLYGAITGLLKEYQLLSPQIEVERVSYASPGRAEIIRAQYKLGARSDENRIIFDANGRWRSVSGTELSEFSIGPDREFRRSAFKGEQMFTSALISVTSLRKAKAYFLTGHGEHHPESEDDWGGYSRFSKMLSESDVEVAVIEALHNREVPEDCSLLIVAGAARRFSREELERMDRYLTQGGRMLVLFPMLDPRNPVTGLESLMAKWNVDVGLNQVQDLARSSTSGDFKVVVSQFGPHPITRPMNGLTLEIVMPRSISARAPGGGRADAPKSVELFFTGPEGVAAGKIDEKGMGEAERTGAIPLAVAVEKGGIQGVKADRGATRIVAVGSSVSFANAPFLAGANADFANLAVSWLLNRDELLTDIAPRALAGYTLTVTEETMSILRWAFLAGAPWTALAIGGIVWLRRRK